MIKWNVLVFLLIITQVSCTDKAASHMEVSIYNDYLLKSYEQYKASWLEKRTAIEFESGVSANNCESYVKHLAESTIKEEINNQIIKSEYLVCEALSIIGEGKLIKSKDLTDSGEVLSSRLDLSSFPSSLFMMLDEGKNTLAQLDPENISSGKNYTYYETDDWSYKLEVVATLDINKNGKDDWVIWLSDE